MSIAGWQSSCSSSIPVPQWPSELIKGQWCSMWPDLLSKWSSRYHTRSFPSFTPDPCPSPRPSSPTHFCSDPVQDLGEVHGDCLFCRPVEVPHPRLSLNYPILSLPLEASLRFLTPSDLPSALYPLPSSSESVFFLRWWMAANIWKKVNSVRVSGIADQCTLRLFHPSLKLFLKALCISFVPFHHFLTLPMFPSRCLSISAVLSAVNSAKQCGF